MKNQKNKTEILEIFKKLPNSRKEKVLNILKEIVRKEEGQNDKKDSNILD